MFDQSTYNLTQSLQGKIVQTAFAKYREANPDTPQPQVDPIFQIRQGYAESPGWVMVQVLEFDPEPLTVELFRRRAVFSSPTITLAMLELLASSKLVDRRGEAYHLLDAGREYLQGRRQYIREIVSCSPIMYEIDQIHAEMAKVIEQCLQSAVDTWCLSYSRRRAPSDDELPILHLLQFCQDFNAFRDDAHMAAYGEYQVSGHVWEAFAFIKNEQATDALSLFDQLAYRGFAIRDWQLALDELVERKWLAVDGDAYQVTDDGHNTYRAVEAKTDQIFFAPWKRVSKPESLIKSMQSIVDQ